MEVEGNGAALSSMESIKEEVDVEEAIGGGREVEMAQLASMRGNGLSRDTAALEQEQGLQVGVSSPPSASSDDGHSAEEVRLLDVEQRTDSAFEDNRPGRKRGDDIEEFVSISIRSVRESVPVAGSGRAAQNAASAKIIKAEEREEGFVKQRMYLAYLGSWGPWFWVPIVVITLAAVERSLQVKTWPLRSNVSGCCCSLWAD